MEGAYFVTVCTKERKECFGQVINNVIQLSRIRIVVDKYWREIPKHFPFVILDEYIVMPNHIHGIIIINHNYYNNPRRDVAMQRLYHRNKQRPKNYQMSMISPKPQSLSVIIRSYKSICTREINKYQNHLRFQWQSRFYDHIIRNEHALQQIQEYIIDNALNWQKDRNNVENLYI